MTGHPCRNCTHPHDQHPNGFLCSIEGCRCPGFFGDRKWMRERGEVAS